MATLDFTPLYRSAVGFDHVPSLLTHALSREESSWHYPPYNIEKCSEDQYRIVMAVAGFTREDIEIVCERNRLTVRGQLRERDGVTYLHRGIAGRAFERNFDLADFIEVTGATMGDGLLVLDLRREIPEELKPRTIPINAGKFVSLGGSDKPLNGLQESSEQHAA